MHPRPTAPPFDESQLLLPLLTTTLNASSANTITQHHTQPLYDEDIYDCYSMVQTTKHIPGRNRFGSIRFGSGLFDNSSVRFGSVRKIKYPGSTRFGLRFSNA